MAVSDTLQERTGPLPNWAWAGLVTIIAAIYLIYRKKQQMANTAANPTSTDSSNLGTVPISNLTTEAAPMPTMGGDTFVNVTTPGPAGPQGPAGPAGSSSSTGTSSAHTMKTIGTYSGATWGIKQGGSPGAYDLYKNGKFFGSYWLKPGYTAVPGTPFTIAGSKLSSGNYKADVKAGKQFAGVWTL